MRPRAESSDSSSPALSSSGRVSGNLPSGSRRQHLAALHCEPGVRASKGPRRAELCSGRVATARVSPFAGELVEHQRVVGRRGFSSSIALSVFHGPSGSLPCSAGAYTSRISGSRAFGWSECGFRGGGPVGPRAGPPGGCGHGPRQRLRRPLLPSYVYVGLPSACQAPSSASASSAANRAWVGIRPEATSSPPA